MKDDFLEKKKYYLKILDSCLTKADFCRALNLSPKGGNYKTINNIIINYRLDDSNLKGLSWKKSKKVCGTRHYSLDEVLVKDSVYKNTGHLKKRLFKEHVKEEKCELCDSTEKLELHHINGDSRDNRIENLQILCPSCHAKTHNYRGKNISTRVFTPCSETILTDEEVEQRNIERKEKRRVVRKTPTISSVEQICKCCGQVFHARHYQKYCGQECYREDNKGNRPTLIQLINDFKELKSFVQVGNKYNITDNAVRKWCRLYGLPVLTNEMKIFVEKFNSL